MERSLHLRDSLGAHADAARRNSRLQRLLWQAAIALVASYWLGWWSLAWLLATQGATRFLDPLFHRRLLPFIVQRWPKLEKAAKAGFHASMAAVFAMVWTSAWAVGGEGATFFAAAMLFGQLIHALVYFAGSRTFFLARIIPPILGGVLTPILFQPPASAFLVVPILVIGLVRVFWSYRDQVALYEKVSRESAFRRAAEEAGRAKAAFMAVVTHELRTPLNAVINYAEILEEDLNADGLQERAADAARIRRSGRNLLTAIESVITFAELEADRVKPFMRRTDIVGVVEGEVERARAWAHAAGDTLTFAPVMIEPIWTDPDRVRQCLSELLTNACRYTDRAGIVVRCEEFVGGDGRRWLRIDVQDSGCGIAPESMAHLFEPFAQADVSHTRKRDGLGLGLAIAKRLALLLGGDLSVTTELGRGSTFTFTIPDAPPNADHAKDKDIEATPA